MFITLTPGMLTQWELLLENNSLLPVGECQEQFAMIEVLTISMMNPSFTEGTMFLLNLAEMCSNTFWINLGRVESNLKLQPTPVTQAVVDLLWMIKDRCALLEFVLTVMVRSGELITGMFKSVAITGSGLTIM